MLVKMLTHTLCGIAHWGNLVIGSGKVCHVLGPKHCFSDHWSEHISFVAFVPTASSRTLEFFLTKHLNEPIPPLSPKMSTMSRSILSLTRRIVTSSTFARVPLSISRQLTPLSQLRVCANKFDSVRFASNAVSNNKREQELSEFLVSEIELEKESQKQPLPKLPGWTVSQDGSDVTFFKKYNNEEITIKANICYSVDSANPEADNGQMVCKPDFAIEIKKGDTILGLNCSFIQEEENMEEDGQRLDKIEDDFQINEISMYEGEFDKNNYAISGDVVDGQLYDMLMNILEDRGIDQEFAKSLTEYSTVYEHSQYVSLLENLKKFFN